MEENLELPAQAPEEAPPPPADVVDVRFRVTGRAGTFALGDLRCQLGAALVVQSERGPELGEATGPARSRFPREDGKKLPRVLRVATAEDLSRARHNRGQEAAAGKTFRTLAAELHLPLKLLRVDYRFDGGKAAFYFMSTKDRVDFRGLARDLSQKLHTRVEMRQIGDRDAASLVGGMGPCGRELCCSSWIREFTPVSIRHAKEQGLSLNPGKLAGMCGRLKCCLRYEYDTYVELRRGLPSIGKKVHTIHGEGVVIQQAILKRQVVVRRFDDDVYVHCSLEDLVEKKSDTATEGGSESIAATSPSDTDAATSFEDAELDRETESEPEISEWEAASTPAPKGERPDRGETGRGRGGQKRRGRNNKKSASSGSEKAAAGKNPSTNRSTDGKTTGGENQSRRRPRGRRRTKPENSSDSS
ncbi:MAG: regulatory iron-sulfur-containing complex subunit RicT [Deltaproteobacteria bacterium]